MTLKIPPDLVFAQKLVYSPCNLKCQNFILEIESQAYSAVDFEINDLNIKFRVAKTTPTKTGQFVTLWKRIGKGPILPFDAADPIDFFVISVRKKERLGQFVFSKRILIEKGILSTNELDGKRALRVYPPWDDVGSKQAIQTQKWQSMYFFEICLKGLTDFEKVLELYSKSKRTLNL